jgi:hypothetical protein
MSNTELRELVASLAVAQRETDRQLKETDRQLKETGLQLKETDRQLRETGSQLKETDRKLTRLESVFGMQFGRMTEAILSPGCLKLFQTRGIAVAESMRRLRTAREGEELEIDLLLVNGAVAIMVEMKAAFKVGDVDDLVEDLGRFREFFPKYREHTLHGAVAAFEYLEESDRYAHRKGLFVLRSSEETVAIANPLNFKPRKY